MVSMLKKVFYLVFLLLSVSSYAKGVYRLSLDLKAGSYEVEVSEDKGSYLIKNGITNAYMQIADDQVYILDNTGKDESLEHEINYQIGVSDNRRGLFYPLRNYDFYIENSNPSSLNSILITTQKKGNEYYHFVLKYDYIPTSNSFVLEGIYYLETDISQYGSEFAAFKLKLDVPDSVKYLDRYDRKSTSKFIVDELYGDFSKHDIQLIKRGEYHESKDEVITNQVAINNIDTSYLEGGLCDRSMEETFSCVLDNKKIVSLCSSESKMLYRYGDIGNVELQYPSKDGQKLGWRLIQGNNLIQKVFFNLSSYNYSLTRTIEIIDFLSAEISETYNLSVEHDGNTIFSRKCEEVIKPFPDHFGNKFK